MGTNHGGCSFTYAATMSSMKWIVTAVVVGSVVIAGAGCSSKGSERSTATTATTATTETTATTATTAPATAPTRPSPAEFAALEQKLVQQVPDYVLEPDAVGDTGPSDLAKAKRDDGTKAGADLLVRNGFKLGYQKLFVDPAEDQVIIFAYDFNTVAGAKAMCQSDAQRDVEEQGKTPMTELKVPGVPTVYARSGSDGKYSATVIEFTTGTHCIRIIGNGTARASFTSPAATVAKQQYQLLQ